LKQLTLFPQQSFLPQIINLDDFSIDTSSILDNLQIQELEKALTLIINLWLENLYNSGLVNDDMNLYEHALSDISINWLRAMLQIIKKIDPTFILNENYNRDEVLFLQELENLID